MVSAPAEPPLEAAEYWLPAAPVVVKRSLPKADIPASAGPVDARSADKRRSNSSGHYDINKSIEVIRVRPDFLAANRGKRYVTPSFVLLIHKRRENHKVETDTIRYGITVTKKIGNAVARNRVKRRFRALLAELLPQFGIAGADHIMIGRKEGDERQFSAVKADLEKGLKHLAKKL